MTDGSAGFDLMPCSLRASTHWMPMLFSFMPFSTVYGSCKSRAGYREFTNCIAPCITVWFACSKARFIVKALCGSLQCQNTPRPNCATTLAAKILSLFRMALIFRIFPRATAWPFAPTPVETLTTPPQTSSFFWSATISTLRVYPLS